MDLYTGLAMRPATKPAADWKLAGARAGLTQIQFASVGSVQQMVDTMSAAPITDLGFIRRRLRFSA